MEKRRKQERKNTEEKQEKQYMLYQVNLCSINMLKSGVLSDVFISCDEAWAGVTVDATPHPSASVLLHQAAARTSDAIFWSRM